MKTAPITLIKRSTSKDLDFSEHLIRLEQITKIRKKTSLWVDYARIEIDTHGCPFLFFRPHSDWHLGSMGMDFQRGKEELADLENLPLITGIFGDMGDFFAPMRHPEGMMSNAITPDDQLVMVRKFLQKFQDKIICTVQDPSHTDWIRQLAGIEPQRYLVEDLSIPAIKGGGVLDVVVNKKVTYTFLVFHEIGRFRSSLNLTNAHKRMLDIMNPSADFVIAGHSHIGAMEKAVKMGKKPYFIQMGTMKTNDGFGTRKGLAPRPMPFYPTLMLYTHEKRYDALEDPVIARLTIRSFCS